MRKWIKLLITAAVIITALGAPCLVFITRPPALLLIDTPIATLYGTKRAKRQQTLASLALFRRVRPVEVANGASPDIVSFAVSEAHARPFCVVFPQSYSQAAEYYHEQQPEIPVALLGGYAAALPSPDDFFYVYGSDRETDLYRAGLLAGILSRRGRQLDEEDASLDASSLDAPALNIVLWHDRSIRKSQREFFTRGAGETGPEYPVVFTGNASGMPDNEKVSCVVLAGAGGEYLDKNPHPPVILFAWLDPAITSREVMVIFDDSPWALAVPAVRLAAKKQEAALIPSKTLIFSGKVADNGIFRSLKESVKKRPEIIDNVQDALTNN